MLIMSVTAIFAARDGKTNGVSSALHRTQNLKLFTREWFIMDATVSGFLKFLEAEKGYSENTVAAYRNDLTQFTRFINANVSDNWSDVTRNHIDDYIVELKDTSRKPYSSSTIARKVAAIKSFFHYLIAEGVVQLDPTATLDSPKVKKRLPKVMSIEDINKLLDVTNADDAPKSRRDHAMLELLYASGMRVTELVSLNVDDVDFSESVVRVKAKKHGVKERYIPVVGDASDALKTYIEQGRRQLLHTQTESALFLNHRGQRLTRDRKSVV